jgi:uncharacterized integral membrane protein (TIGR00698 family)
MVKKIVTMARKHGLIGAALLAAGLIILLITGYIPGLSALLVAIVIGAIVGNLRIVRPAAAGSISWGSKKFLRLGIVLLGFKLSLSSLAEIGIQGVAALLITVTVTFLLTVAIGRALGVSRITRMLVATGFSICGASAVAAMSSIVDPRGESEEDTAQAIALVTIYGTIAMFLLPALVPLLGLSDLQAGIWIGASVHEVAQVVAAGGIVSASALALATVAKLGRVVLLAPLIAIVGAAEHRRFADTTAKRPPLLPLFVAGFLAAVLIRTFIPLPDALLTVIEFAANLLLATAMLGLGFGVDLRKMIATGWRPLILGGVSTVVAAGTALGTIVLLGV